jgi:hypothetical protein
VKEKDSNESNLIHVSIKKLVLPYESNLIHVSIKRVHMDFVKFPIKLLFGLTAKIYPWQISLFFFEEGK